MKVNIISGFLGAGKTTLIKKLIAESLKDEKVILLENEYGEIGIDGGFMKDSGIEVTELNSGCICCTLVGDFTKAINEIIEKFHPDRLLIEPSGVGKLSDIKKVVLNAQKDQDIVLLGCATVVDVNKCKMYLKNFGEFFNDQVENADAIIFSRTQDADEEKIQKAIEMLREHNTTARIITTPWETLEASTILGAIENPTGLLDKINFDDDDDDDDEEDEHEHHHHEHDEECGCEHHHHDGEHDHEHHHDHDHEHHHDHDGECSCGHHHHHHGHDADEAFDSVGWETIRKFDEAGLRAMLTSLEDAEKYGVVLRAKGIVPAADGRWIHFDFVPGDISVRCGSADYTGRLCVIGVKLNDEALRSLFGV